MQVGWGRYGPGTRQTGKGLTCGVRRVGQDLTQHVERMGWFLGGEGRGQGNLWVQSVGAEVIFGCRLQEVGATSAGLLGQ